MPNVVAAIQPQIVRVKKWEVKGRQRARQSKGDAAYQYLKTRVGNKPLLLAMNEPAKPRTRAISLDIQLRRAEARETRRHPSGVDGYAPGGGHKVSVKVVVQPLGVRDGLTQASRPPRLPKCRSALKFSVQIVPVRV